MNKHVNPQSIAKSKALSTRAKPNKPTPTSVLVSSGVIAIAVSKPLKRTPTPRPTAPIALKARPAATYSPPTQLTINLPIQPHSFVKFLAINRQTLHN